jgi:Signal transduction histidine kinase, nitrate/nitrite-specific
LNSLLKKYLFYNLLGLVLLAIATTVLIVVLNNYHLNKRLKEIDNQNLIIYNFLNSSNFLRNNNSQIIYDAILSKLEIKNLSILILDNEGNVVIDTKGYDVASGSINASPLIEIEKLGEYPNNNKILNSNKKTIEFREFLKNEIFIEKHNNSKIGIKSSFSIPHENKKLELFSILPVNLNDDIFHIVAYEDNTVIQRINNQIRFNVLLAGLAIAFSLILFSFFLNFIILKPIKKLAKAAENVDADVKSKPLITVLDRREDEIGQLSKIINTMA